MSQIYLDYNATTPVHPRVFEVMRPHLTEVFGNPSSPHEQGREARRAVDRARDQVAAFLGCSPDEIIFTSGGSESNNHAIKGASFALRGRGNHIVTSRVEHPAVDNVCRFLEGEGFQTTYVPVDEHGLVDPDRIAENLRDETLLVSVMHANNEVGTVQPIDAIARAVKRKGLLVHTDAAQSAGKIPVRVDDLDVDLLSLAGHKLYAPKGIGALYVRQGVELTPLIHGAGHESGRRAGTENVAYIAGFGMACELAGRELDAHARRVRALRDRFHEAVRKKLPQVRLNGHPSKRLPNTVSLSFPGYNAAELIEAFEGLAVSAGAACHGSSVEPSKVLKAMEVPLEFAAGTIRFSLGRFTTEDEIDRASRIVVDALDRIRPTYPG